MFERLMANRERHARLMGEMMRRYGTLQGDTITICEAMSLERAARRCMDCGSVEVCARWMEQTEGTDGAERFCPNAKLFASL
ncbi:hypothetical protein EDC22_10984 [Tepidamorphus gemmatus]|jgi:hypothetical protein|uniref:DUF6455 domain-containing protein n=1 Tax=Tepidamorphus gemmatus TaxID=747076 RepID=A0A4V2UYQ8_9HYPH|nr:DUF6455 family protein [Tepidamorphus gemmatus]TCT08408.1 hypothetical protein EDC22_10984 [Tepidamorphus gemmatus]